MAERQNYLSKPFALSFFICAQERMNMRKEGAGTIQGREGGRKAWKCTDGETDIAMDRLAERYVQVLISKYASRSRNNNS